MRQHEEEEDAVTVIKSDGQMERHHKVMSDPGDREEEEAPEETVLMEKTPRDHRVKPNYEAMLATVLAPFEKIHLSKKHVQKELQGVRNFLARVSTQWDETVDSASKARKDLPKVREELARAEADMLAALRRKEAAEGQLAAFTFAIWNEKDLLARLELDFNRSVGMLGYFLKEHC